MKLYEISGELQRLWAEIEAKAEENGGEIPAELTAELEKLELAREEKALNVARLLRNFDIEADAVAAEAKRMKAKADTLAKRADYLREYLATNVPQGSKISDGILTISWRKNPPKVIVPDDSRVPDQFCNFTRTVSKSELKDFLQGGGTCDFAHLEQGQSLVVK